MRRFLLLFLILCSLALAQPPANTAVKIPDNKNLVLGTSNDYYLQYDETTDDKLELGDGTNTFVSVSDAGTTAAVVLYGTLNITLTTEMDGALTLDDTSLKITEGVDTLTLTVPTLTAARAVTLPDAAGEISLLGQTIESAEITDGTIVAADLATDSVEAAEIAADAVGTAELDDAADTPVAGQAVVVATDTGKIEYIDFPTGTGDVAGPASSTDNAIPRFNGTGGKTLQGSGVTIDDNDQITAPGQAHTFGDGSGYSYIYFNGGAGFYRRFLFQSNGSGRWDIGADSSAESGGDAGSDFLITARDDSGVNIDDYFKIDRADGDVRVKYLLKLGSSGITANDSTGYILDAALAQNGATAGQFKAWTGSTWAPKSRNGVVLLTASGALLPTSNPATAPALDANDNMVVEYAASDNAFWQICVPEDYDGSVESIKVFWYKADTNAVTWTLANAILADGTAMTQGYTGGGSNSGTPAANSLEITSITDTDILGSSSDTGKMIKMRVSSDAFTGTSAFLVAVKMEY